MWLGPSGQGEEEAAEEDDLELGPGCGVGVSGRAPRTELLLLPLRREEPGSSHVGVPGRLSGHWQGLLGLGGTSRLLFSLQHSGPCSLSR